MPSFFGAGLSPAGSSDAGYGAVDIATIPAPDLFRNPYGVGNLTGRRIDPVTRDYSMSSTGNILGMTRAQQYVELVFLTNLGSSCLSSLGNDLSSIAVISDSIVTDIQSRIRDALAEGVNSGLIEIVSIDVNRFRPTGEQITTRWRDLSTGQEQKKVI